MSNLEKSQTSKQKVVREKMLNYKKKVKLRKKM